MTSSQGFNMSVSLSGKLEYYGSINVSGWPAITLLKFFLFYKFIKTFSFGNWTCYEEKSFKGHTFHMNVYDQPLEGCFCRRMRIKNSVFHKFIVGNLKCDLVENAFNVTHHSVLLIAIFTHSMLPWKRNPFSDSKWVLCR